MPNKSKKSSKHSKKLPKRTKHGKDRSIGGRRGAVVNVSTCCGKAKSAKGGGRTAGQPATRPANAPVFNNHVHFAALDGFAGGNPPMGVVPDRVPAVRAMDVPRAGAESILPFAGGGGTVRRERDISPGVRMSGRRLDFESPVVNHPSLSTIRRTGASGYSGGMREPADLTASLPPLRGSGDMSSEHSSFLSSVATPRVSNGDRTAALGEVDKVMKEIDDVLFGIPSFSGASSVYSEDSLDRSSLRTPARERRGEASHRQSMRTDDLLAGSVVHHPANRVGKSGNFPPLRSSRGSIATANPRWEDLSASGPAAALDMDSSYSSNSPVRIREHRPRRGRVVRGTFVRPHRIRTPDELSIHKF